MEIMDNYSKDGGPKDLGRSDFCVVFTMSLCALGPKKRLYVFFFKSCFFEIGYTCFERIFEANL